MPDLRDEITHWSLGVVTSGEPDREDLRNALVRADNSMFVNIAARVATIRKRYGMTLVNSTPFDQSSSTTGPALVGGLPYIYENAGVKTRYTAVVNSNGRVIVLQDDGVATNHTGTTMSVFLGSGVESPDFAEMNNRVFVLDGRGATTALIGNQSYFWGVPSTTISSLAPNGAGSMTGTYDVLVTVWDSLINAESEISPVVQITGLAANGLRIAMPAPIAFGRHIRVYLRKPSVGPGFYRVLAGTNYVGGTTMGFPWTGAINIDINVSDATLASLALIPPAINSRGLPPSGIKYAAVFNSRMVVATDTHVYWSEQDLPDAFNPANSQPIRSPKGGVITGLKAIPVDADTSILSIFTETARHQVIGGINPASWEWSVPDPDVGAVSNRSIAVDGSLLFWWSAQHGPVMRELGSGIAFIGKELIKDKVEPAALNQAELRCICAAAHDNRVVWAVPDPTKTRNTRLVVFNTGMRRWESPNWDPMDVGTLFVNYDTSARGYLALGNYNGQLFRMLKGSNDGVRAGTNRGTFVAGATSTLSITDGAAAFDTTGAGLKERKVTLVNSSGLVHGSIRPRITANTATGLTLDVAFTGLTVGATYTYVVGGPDFNMETYWWNMGVPFTLKRFDRLYMQFRADAGVSDVSILTAYSWTSLEGVSSTPVSFTGGLWDEAYWNLGFWDATQVLNRKVSVLKTGTNFRVGIRNPYPDQGFDVLKIGLLARQLNDA